MHRAFKLTPTKFPAGSGKKGSELSDSFNNKIQKCFSSFISEGEINGTLLRDHWFPEINADVFISHSHQDEEKAKELSGWLHNSFGISSFIDSDVWGYSDDLLRKFDDIHCWQKESNTYNYRKRNGTTSHVHMMLATALSRMIDSAECVIFVSTPNSVSSSKGLDTQVSSPWIFYELSQMEVIRKRPIEDYRLVKKSERHDFSQKESAEEESLKVKYEVDFNSLTTVNPKMLTTWHNLFNSDRNRHTHALDFLYEVAPLKKLVFED